MSTVAYPAYRLNRQKLLISCATLAIAAVALAPQRAKAQAFQGSPTTAAGTVSYSRQTPGSETITIGSNTATINWAPSDVQGAGNVNFLPAGNTATYLGGANLTDFTVLNRIVPTDVSRTIEFNGTVLSKLATGGTGGNIWFYSPGGILVGSQASFDVGGLLLTSIDLPNGFTTGTNSFSTSFSKTQTNAGSVTIAEGAQINARNSYVAVVAPRIEQGGNVQVNGSAAYAAADGLTMTFNSGLFSFSVPVGSGTSDGNGIVHTGTTGGAANSTITDNHHIYMVAVPKNQALTMLLDGAVGFAPVATEATFENGQVVLSSGSNSVSGPFGNSLSVGGQSGLVGNIKIGSTGAATYTSSVVGYATSQIQVDASVGDVRFDHDLTLVKARVSTLGDVSLTASNGRTLSVGGSATLESRSSSAAPTVQIAANGGNIHIGGDASLTAGPASVAGIASLSATNGTLTIDGRADIDVSVDLGFTSLPATDGDAADITDRKSVV